MDIPELTTETQKVVANPDGTFTSQIHGGPARFKDAKGNWIEVDLTLARRPDGSVAPKAHRNGLTLSGAAGTGEHDLAKMTIDGHEVALGWRGKLPEPVLDRTKATWTDVLPGIDLVVEVTRSGFEQFIVVKNRAAAALVSSVSLPWRSSGLTEKPVADGSTELVDATGKVKARIPVARMWDARVSKSGDRIATAPVSVKITTGKATTGQTPSELHVIPDARFLNDPHTEYPVTIDPSVVTLSPGFDTFVQTGYTSDQSGSTDLKLGYADDGGVWTARSYLRFDGLNGYAYANVVSAVMYLWEYHSWSCTAAGWEAWRVGWADSSARWTKQPSWNAKIGSSTLTKGHDSACDDGWVTIDVRGGVQHAFSNNWSSLPLGLRASSETNHNGWKRFHSSQAASPPYISLTYNRPPTTPSGLKAQGKTCAAGMTVSTTSGQPTLQASVSDPDGDTISAKFFLAEQGAVLPSTPTATASASSGSVATVTVPTSVPLVEGRTYYWQVEGADSTATGPRSGSCEFKVDNGTTQTPPLVTSDGVYPRNGSGGGPGVTGLFTFAANGVTTVDRYQFRTIYRGVTSPWQERTVTAGGSTKIKWTPPFDDGLAGNPVPVEQLNQGGQLKLEVRMGNPTIGWFNNVETYTTQVLSAPGLASHWTMNDPDGSAQLVDEIDKSETLPQGQRPATAHNLTKSVDGRGDYGTSWHFNGVDAYAEAPFAVTYAPSSTYQSDSFTISAWVKLADKNSDRTVAARKYDQFELEYNKVADRWLFTVDGSSYWGVLSKSQPQIGVWTHLAGVFDFKTREIRLYVNGIQEGDSVFVDAYSDDNDMLYIGKSTTDFWSGEIDDVRVWKRVLDPREIAANAGAEAAAWRLDVSLTSASSSPFEPYDLTAYDSTGMVDITSNVEDPMQASWWSPVGHTPGDGGSIKLDAAAQRWLQVQPSVLPTVVRTDQSFTVSAWVHLDTMPSGPDYTTWTAVAQDGTCRSGFFLGAKMLAGQANWFFGMSDRDASEVDGTCDSPSGVRVSAPIATAQVGQVGSGETATDVWVQLVGVFDAGSQQAHLYVDGQHAGVVARTARWAATGPFTIGRALWASSGTAGNLVDFFPGRIDTVKIIQGVQAPETVTREFLLDGGTISKLNTRVPIVAATGSASCQTAESPAKVFDGLMHSNSKWCSSATSKWVQVQLGGQETLTGIVVAHAAAAWETSDYNTKDFDIQTSTDGTTWTTAAQVRGNTSGVSRHTFASPVSAEYVKLVIITPTQNGNSAARIYEIAPYKGTKVPITTVTPSSTSSCASTEGADKTIDGVIAGSKWCAWPMWADFDLGSEQTFSSVAVWHAGAGNEYTGWNTVDFDIYASVDGSHWTLLQQVRGNINSVSFHDLQYPINARYLKIDVNEPAITGYTRQRIYEIEVYK